MVPVTRENESGHDCHGRWVRRRPWFRSGTARRWSRGWKGGKPVVKKSWLIPAGVLLALLLVEVFLRLTGVGLRRPELSFDLNTRTALEMGQFVPDRKLFWREGEVPDPELHRRLRLIRPGDDPPPKTRKYRILCLGDSCTRLSLQGWPYSGRLEERLGRRFVEVFNASLPGYTSYQGLAWLESQLLDYRPDLVIVYFGWNDHWRSTGLADRELAARLNLFRPRLVGLFQGLHEPPPVRVSVTDFQHNLRAIAELVARHQGQTVLLTAPAFFTPEATAHHVQSGYILPGDNPEGLHLEYQRAVRQLAGTSGLRVFDAAEVFDRLNDPQLLLHRDGVHPTEFGHMVLAATLAGFISQNSQSTPTEGADPVAVGLAVIAQGMSATGRWADALERYERSVALAPGNQGPLLGLAWLLATCPDEGLRNPTRALDLLAGLEEEQASAFQFLDVKAAVLAANGRFDEAAAAARKALDLIEAQGGGFLEMAEAIRTRLTQYEASEPFLHPSPSQP